MAGYKDRTGCQMMVMIGTPFPCRRTTDGPGWDYIESTARGNAIIQPAPPPKPHPSITSIRRAPSQGEQGVVWYLRGCVIRNDPTTHMSKLSATVLHRDEDICEDFRKRK